MSANVWKVASTLNVEFRDAAPLCLYSQAHRRVGGAGETQRPVERLCFRGGSQVYLAYALGLEPLQQRGHALAGEAPAAHVRVGGDAEDVAGSTQGVAGSAQPVLDRAQGT